MAQHDSRLDRLGQLYDLYDAFMAKTDLVCRKGCASCCTCNVTLTSLELDYITAALGPEKTGALTERVENNLAKKRFQPKTRLSICAPPEISPLGVRLLMSPTSSTPTIGKWPSVPPVPWAWMCAVSIS